MHWIFLRGLAREQGHWLDFPQAFQKKFPTAQIECLDSFGNGTEYFEKSFLSIEESVDELQKRSLFFQEKKSPLFLFSISMGSMLAVQWAEKFPDRFQGMVLINTSDQGSSKFFQRLRPENYPGLLQAVFEKGIHAREKKILEMVTNLLPRNNPKQMEKIIKAYAQLAEKHPLSGSNFLRQILAAARYRFPPKAPLEKTLLLASKEDRLVSVQCSQGLAKKWNLKCFEHSQAGHDLPLDDPDWILEQIQNHLLN